MRLLREVRQQVLNRSRLLSKSGFFAPIWVGNLLCLHIRKVLGERLRLTSGRHARTAFGTLARQPRAARRARVAHSTHVFITSVVADCREPEGRDETGLHSSELAMVDTVSDGWTDVVGPHATVDNGIPAFSLT